MYIHTYIHNTYFLCRSRDDPWKKRKKRHSEVLFPNDFTKEHPEGEPWKELYPNTPKIPKDIQVPILTLGHVTHDTEVKQIRKYGDFRFLARQKLGKDFSDTSWGISYKFERSYVEIPPDKPVFPGYYSWWGIYPQQDYSNVPESEHFTSPAKVSFMIATDFKGERVYPPDYLKEKPDSMYGNHAFSCNFPALLSTYAKSRSSEVAEICIRKGGTLRYTKEICYVLIICIDVDKNRKELSEYAPLQPMKKQIHTNGLIDTSGKITDVTAVPTFNPEHIITWVTGKGYSYETLALAFYFPEEGSIMSMGPECRYEGTIYHSKCKKTVRPPEGGERRCPNEYQPVHKRPRLDDTF